MKNWVRAVLTGFMIITAHYGSVAFATGRQCADLFEIPTSAARVQAAYQSYREDPRWWTSHSLYYQHLKVVREFSVRIEMADAAIQAEAENPRFNGILKKIIIDPKTTLSSADLEFISSRKTYRDFFENALRIAMVGEFQFRFVQRINQYWTGRAAKSTLVEQPGIKHKALYLLRSIYNGPIRFLSPVPLMRSWTPVDRIFEQQFENPKTPLSEKNLAILREAGAEEAYRAKQAFIKERPTWTTFRRWVRNAAVAAITLNSALVANLGAHLSEPKAFVDVNHFMEEPGYRLKENQVRVINETVPFPHMAIEIDGKVYSYGVSEMKVSSAYEYLNSQNIATLLEARAKATGQTVGTGGLLNKSFEATGLSSLPRSVEMVTLNLSKAEKDRLKRSLEMSTGKTYRNHTLVLDCATMVVLALKRNSNVYVPKIIDASPSNVVLYLAALKSFETLNNDGEPLVADIRQVAMAEADRPLMHLSRNLFINSIEGKLFWNLLPISQMQRSYFDVRYGESGFQFWRPEVRAVIESWQQTSKAEIFQGARGDQLERFQDEARSLGQTPLQNRDGAWQARSTAFRQMLDYYFILEITRLERRTQSADTSFEDAIRSAYEADFLRAMKINFINIASDPQARLIQPKSAAEVLDQIH